MDYFARSTGVAGARISPRVPVTISSAVAPGRGSGLDDQQRCRQQDCRRQRNRHKSDRCLHHVSRRDANHRAFAFSEMVQIKICRDYAGTGIAMVTLVESTVSAITRHSDNAPIASEAAMALVNREEATGTGRFRSLPCRATVSLVKSLPARANHPRTSSLACNSRPAILRRPAPEKWQNHGKQQGFARYLCALPAIPAIQSL